MTDNELKTVEKYRAEVPVRLGALAQELGIEVFNASLKPDISGLIEPSPTAPSGFRIRLNRHEPIERQRFTLAHEIAHFLLHRADIGGGVVDNVLYRSSLSSRKEVEANKLAARIIMPIDSIRAERDKLSELSDNEAAAVLASKFRVSLPAMKIRLGL